jgi:putative sterol carrier protein
MQEDVTMAEPLFSDAWMKQLMDAWNSEPEVKDALAAINFNSVIACGFKGEDKPRGVFVVESGVCVRAGDYGGESPDWDMRADKSDWMKWVEKGIGMTGLGMAFATGKLKFLKGDYAGMLKDPRMAGPFVKSFGLMQRIGAV